MTFRVGQKVVCVAGKPIVDVFYWATRFRPIVERKTSIEIFKRMLTDQKIDA